MNNSIKAYSYEEILAILAELGQPKFRADQLIEWIYARGATNYAEMSNLPSTLREVLEQRFPLNPPEIINLQSSLDGTRKYVLAFADGTRTETVAIPSRISSSQNIFQGSNLDRAPGESKYIGKAGDRMTVCVSTQVGCALGCSFCATGKEGFTRNLLPGEIVDQVLIAQADMGIRASNVVTMGQGEPFLNYNNTLAALRFINSSKGVAIGARHITISTCGITKGIRTLAEEPEQFTLAVSLHSAEQKVRNTLMPKMENEPLSKLKEALMYYIRGTNRRVSLEYIMIQGVNDTRSSYESLLTFCKGLLCHVNLLTFNETNRNTYIPSTKAKAWAKKLEEEHIPTTIRNSKGADIAGACGQLKNSLSNSSSISLS